MDANLLVAILSAGMQAIDTWITFRDRQGAAKSAHRVRTLQREPDIQSQARMLEELVPAPVLEKMSERVQRCWDSYTDVLDAGDDDYLPQEVDDATEAVKRCICRELRRIRDLNGGIPDGQMKRWWAQYCAESHAQAAKSQM